MDELRRYFGSTIHQEMKEFDFRNWLIKDFLVELLVSFLKTEEREILCLRKGPALALSVLDNDYHRLQNVAENLLLLLGIFPENLVNVHNRRTLGLKDYFNIERLIVRRISFYNNLWREIDGNFVRTIKVLNGARSNMTFREPDIVVITEVVKTLNPYFLL